MQFYYKNELEDFRTTAKWLARRGWSEAAGGNMSIRLNALKKLHEDEHKKLPIKVPHLAGQAILLTGSGTRAREIGKDPVAHIGLYKISDDGQYYGWIAGNKNPSMELPAHLAIHNELEKLRPDDKAILHTHPESIISLCHAGFDSGKKISDKILAMQSEARLHLPEGIGFIKQELPGSLELGLKSAELIGRHHLVMWQYHGILATGKTLSHGFDKLEVFEKCARIYWRLKSAGIEPKGISKQQIKNTLKAFGVLDRMG